MNKKMYPIALALVGSAVFAEQENEYFSCQPYTAKSSSTGPTSYQIDCKTETHIIECQRFRIDKTSLSASGGSYIQEYNTNKTKGKLIISRTDGEFYESETTQGTYEYRNIREGVCELKRETLKY